MNDQDNAEFLTDGSDNEGAPASPSSISSAELFPIEPSTFNVEAFCYNDPSSHSGIISAVIQNDLKKIKHIVAQGKSVRIVDNHGNTPLHIAATTSIEGKVEILKYLLTLEDADKNATNHYGQTPLLLSTIHTREEAAYMLIEAGADVRLPSSDDVTPLHHAVRFSAKLSETLILKGADIDFRDYNGDTPMHDSVTYDNIEALRMLLYYRADTDIKNSGGLTPFMQSLAIGEFEKADELFEYVADFNQATKENMSTLFLCITSGYPHVKEMIERGADVNYSENEIYNVFTLGVAPNLDAFQCIWERFNYKSTWGNYCPNILIYLLNNESTTIDYKLRVVEIIFSCENISKMIHLTQESEKYPILHPFVNKLYMMGVSHELVHRYCAILLSCNLKVYDTDLDMVYERYGYCDLFKLLLYMDIRCAGVLKFNIFPYMIYQMKGNFNYLSDKLGIKFSSTSSHNLDRIDYENILDHVVSFPFRRWFGEVSNDSKCHKLLEYINALPQVPKLQELASHKARDFLRVRYCTKNCGQFYTILKYLNIPFPSKQLISFETPLYRSVVTAQFLELRQCLKQAREANVLSLDDAFYNRVPLPSDFASEIRE